MQSQTLQLAEKIEQQAQEIFHEIDRVSLYNTQKVLAAFHEHRISEPMLHGTTGYGYDDHGRDALDAIYAQVFETEDALVRHQFVNGTHTIATVFYAVLRPGDTLLSVTGAPYDTLLETIGVSGEDGRGSLKDFGIRYKQIELLPSGDPDLEQIRQQLLADPSIKMVFMQRSRGYSQRKTLTPQQIKQICDTVKQVRPVCIFADNCYGEFVRTSEPTTLGVDIIAGSLIKNPGGGLAQTGGYIAGKKQYVDLCARRLTSVGIGKECGATLDQLRYLYQGFFMAPHITAQALKTAVFAAGLFQAAGYEVSPLPTEIREDIIQSIIFGQKESLLAFMQGIQYSSPIDSFVTPEPWAMPGYQDEVVMAAGTFVSGASIELSADAPIKPPYRAYFQGGLTYPSGKLAIIHALEQIQHRLGGLT